MMHESLIDGTSYEITKGKSLIKGTSYNISKGKSLIDGTSYEVPFESPTAILYKEGIMAFSQKHKTEPGYSVKNFYKNFINQTHFYSDF